MARSAKLKVYCTAVGFYDALVAAPSQKAALKAWGTTTDLFAAGRASVVDDPNLQAEALAQPGEVVRKMRGDEAAMIGPEPARRARPKVKPGPAASPPRKPAPAPRLPDRSDLDAADDALERAERERAAEIEAIERERAELDRREIRVRSAGKAGLKTLRRARDDAREAYENAVRKAGGR